MRQSRGLVGPVLLGAAAWCAAGTIAVATPASTTPRYGIPAPWWMVVAAAIVAALVPAIRRRPAAALPALLAAVPWCPVPLPPIGLLFTGPLAWLPVAVSVCLAVGAAPIAAVGRAIGADRPSRAPWLAGVATLVLVTATAWSAAPQAPGGDEPHYLIITQSLLEDGDIRIENNHRQGDYRAYFGGHLDPHYIVPGKNGQIYSVHAPGVSALVLPGFALAGYHGAEATVIVLAALTGAALWLIGWRATRDPRAAWFAWAAVATSTTFLIQGFTIFPDGPAMFAVAMATLLLLRLGEGDASPGLTALVLSSVPLAALPWLHTRFAVIAAGFGAAVVVRLATDGARSIGARAVRVAAFAAVPTVVAASWFAFFRIIYGTFNPTAPYGDSAGNHFQYVPGGSLAILFDGQFGLLTYAPALIASAAGWWRPANGGSRRAGLEGLAVVGLYLVAAMTYWMWWAGLPAAPARFFAAMLPVLAVPLAAAWTRGDAMRKTASLGLVAVGCGFALTAIGGEHGALAWNIRDAESRLLGWLGPVVNLRRAWPSFFWTLAPDFSFTNLGSEWRFAGHVALFVGVFVALWLATRTIAGPRSGQPDPFRVRCLVGAWLLAGLAAAVQAGWLVSGITGLDAEPAQAQVLTAARQGGAVAIDALHVSRLARFAGQITLGSQEPGKYVDPPPWFVASNLPAGDYQVTLTMVRPTSGALTITAGDATIAYSASADREQTWTLHVKDDNAGVVMTPADGLRPAGGTIVMTATWGRQ